MTNLLENYKTNLNAQKTDGIAPSASRNDWSWKKFTRNIAIYLVSYVVIAGVSIGPLFWTWFGAVYVDGPKWFARLYLPLAFLCDLIPPLGWLINAWINWWIL